MWTAVQARTATEENQPGERRWLMWLEVAATRVQAAEWRPQVREQSDWQEKQQHTVTF